MHTCLTSKTAQQRFMYLMVAHPMNDSVLNCPEGLTGVRRHADAAHAE